MISDEKPWEKLIHALTLSLKKIFGTEENKGSTDLLD